MLSNLQYMYNVNRFSIGLIESAFKINEYIADDGILYIFTVQSN